MLIGLYGRGVSADLDGEEGGSRAVRNPECLQRSIVAEMTEHQLFLFRSTIWSKYKADGRENGGAHDRKKLQNVALVATNYETAFQEVNGGRGAFTSNTTGPEGELVFDRPERDGRINRDGSERNLRHIESKADKRLK